MYGTKEFYQYKAWEEIYAAEGSDWFWWYGADQGATGGDEPFDEAFLAHLYGMYDFMQKAGWKGNVPEFLPIIRGSSLGGVGTMAQASKMVRVIFECDARHQNVTKAIYIVGEFPELGSWTPNKVMMYDDGTHGDAKKGDGVWTIEFELPEGSSIQYKYTNSGKEGVWVPGEEFPVTNRQIFIRDGGDGTMKIADIFGKI